MSKEEFHSRTRDAARLIETGANLGRAISKETLAHEFDTGSVIEGMELMLSIQETLPYIEIKDEQIECLDAIQEARSNGADKALFQMATGTGKTTVAAAEVKRFLNENPGSRVLFLSHQNRIGDQGRERFESILGTDYTYGNFTSEKRDFHKVDCLFASFQVMHTWREVFLKDEFDYIVVDEAHHSKADTYEPTIEYFKPKFTLAMTATPDRHDMKDIRELFGSEVYKLTLEEAIARNLLAYVDYHVMLDEIAAGHILRDPETKRKLSRKQLNRTIFMTKRDEEIARLCEEKGSELNEPVRRLVFCKSINQTKDLVQYFDDAEPIHNEMSPKQVKDILERYKSGQIKTLLTVNKLNEGIDVPEVNQVVFMRLTESVTIFLQQLGRGLRKLDGKESVQVLDFVANCDRLTLLESFYKRILAITTERDDLIETSFRINGGEFHFSDTTREILEVLNDIEANKTVFRNWAAEDSIKYYSDLCIQLNRLATAGDIKKQVMFLGGPNINLLTKHFNGKLAELREACGVNPMEAQAGWQYNGKVAELLGISRKSVLKLAEEVGVDGVPMVGERGKIGIYFSDDDIPKLIETHKAIPFAPEGWLSALGMRSTHGIKPVALKSLGAQLGITGTAMRNSRGMTGNYYYYSPEEQASIIELAAQIPAVFEGWKNAESISKSNGISAPSFSKIAGNLGITGKAMRSSDGKIAMYFSPIQAQQVLSVFNIFDRAPAEGWISMPAMSSQRNVHRRFADAVAKRLNVPPKKMRNSTGQVSIYYPTEVWEVIKSEVPETRSGSPIPEGHLSVADLVEILEVSESTVLKMAKDLDLKWDLHKNARGRK